MYRQVGRYVGAVVVCLLAAAVVPAISHATFKGKNGVLAIYNGSPVGTPPDDGVDPPERNIYLSIINPDGTGRKVLAADRSGLGLFSPDGRRLAFRSQLPVSCCSTDPAIEVMNVDGSERHVVYAYGDLPYYRSVNDLAGWSSDGATLLFDHHLGKYCTTRVYTVPAASGALTQASNGDDGCFSDVSTSDDVLGWISARRLAFIRFYEDTAGFVRSAVMTVNADGSDERELTAWSREDLQWALSPDGGQIAFLRRTSEPYGFDLFTVGLDGSGLRQLTRSSTVLENFGWSPDGSRLVFTERKDPTSAALRVVKSDGSDASTVMEADLNTAFPEKPSGRQIDAAVWSPDGKRLALRMSQFGSASDADIYVINLDGTALTNITNTPDSAEAVSDWQALPSPWRSDYKNAAKFCRAERDFWGDQFASRYGGGSNAYGKCVSGK